MNIKEKRVLLEKHAENNPGTVIDSQYGDILAQENPVVLRAILSLTGQLSYQNLLSAEEGATLEDLLEIYQDDIFCSEEYKLKLKIVEHIKDVLRSRNASKVLLKETILVNQDIQFESQRIKEVTIDGRYTTDGSDSFMNLAGEDDDCLSMLKKLSREIEKSRYSVLEYVSEEVNE